ncbi:AfsR/SARP family transcriptional regulator [Actinotalea subterranea]|uniref:AfsR/SARP family transcriptional regulator n=1 Tax=Actinotalea subterranea TaxID=2607497 RepID=UPI001FE9CE53|nr:BTAD domain-containing putative transcriptional regulator [Actinotalea subterranea]
MLGPVAAWDTTGAAVPLRGPRHRAVLARLVVARGRTVPVAALVDDLWDEPPPGAVGALRTFVGDLRRALEPDRAPRQPPRLLVTDGAGYALRVTPEAVDALRFERAVLDSPAHAPAARLTALDDALALWRGPAYAELGEHPWAESERARLSDLRLHAVELRAGALLVLGRAPQVAAEVAGHVAAHPWREEGWRLLALALYRSGRQGEALDVLRRARTLLRDELGLDPGRALTALETDILRQAPSLDVVAAAGAPGAGQGSGAGEGSGPDEAPGAREGSGPREAPGAVQGPGPDEAPGAGRGPGRGPEAGDDPAGRVWAQVTARYDQAVGPGSWLRLRSSVDLLRTLAVTGGGGLETARDQRLAAVLAAGELADPELAARVIGGYDVPAIWTRSDDPEQAALVVAAARRALHRLPDDAGDRVRARLLATVAVESRGTADPDAMAAAREAERLARHLDDPALLAFALNGVLIQSFHRAGLAAERDVLGAELVDVAARHELATHEILGHLVRMQACAALGDVAGADRHAAAADALAARHGSPLVGVFTAWYGALRLALHRRPVDEVADAYRAASASLGGAGMPGLDRGLPALAQLALRVERGLPAPLDDLDWGPYEPWARPLVLLARGERDAAAGALRGVPDPPHDHLLEALWCLAARAAIDVGGSTSVPVMRRALEALAPASGELAGAGSGLMTLGPVSGFLSDLRAALAATPPGPSSD